MNNITQYPLIPGSILSFLLDKAGEPEEMSPRRLMPEPSAPTPRQAEELYDAQITASPKINSPLTPKFSHVAQTLLDPKTNLTLRTWGDENSSIETNLQFPGYARDGGGVALNQIDRSYKISAFFDDTYIVKLLGNLVPNLVEPDESLAFEAHLPAAVLTTLFGLLDLYRMPEYPSPPYSSAEINGYIQGRWGLSGFDNLLTYILAMGYSSAPPSQVEVETSLSLLEKMGIVYMTEENTYEIASKLSQLISASRGDLPGLQWERISMDEHGELVLVNRLWLYGSDGLVLMLTPTGNDRVYVSSVSIGAMKDFLISDLLAGDLGNEYHREPDAQNRLKPSPEIPTQDLKVQSTQTIENISTPPLKASAKTIQPEEPAKIRRCPVCGAELLPGAKFCTHCGAPVPEEEEISLPPQKPVKKAKFCPVCGAELLPGAKFCTHCGAKISD